MKFTEGSVINFTPDHSGQFTVDLESSSGQRWTLPVVGWAVVVEWVSEEGLEQDTAIHPCVLTDGGFVTPLRNHLRMDLVAGVRSSLIRRLP